MERAYITRLVLSCLRNLIATENVVASAPLDETTPLIGRASILDSLGLVTLIVDIEQQLQAEYGISVTLADERALSQRNSPFRTVGVLVDYISGLVEERSNVGS